MGTSLKEKIIRTQWAFSSFFDRIKDENFFGPVIGVTLLGSIVAGAGYAMTLAVDNTEMQPRKYTDFPASEFNLISSVKMPESFCSDLDGNVYFAAKNEEGAYLLLEREGRRPTLDVPTSDQQRLRLGQIIECLEDSDELTADELIDLGDDFKFSSTGEIFGPLNLHDETNEENAVVYDFSARSYKSFSSLKGDVENVQELLGDKELNILTTDALQKTWNDIAQGVNDNGFAPNNAENLPTASYQSGTWSKAFSIIGLSAGACFVLGGLFGFSQASGNNGTEIRKKYETKLSLVGRKAIM